ncbi:DUF805 domain-containing protein [Brevibacterium metallidurans]|uniref:DUF805 domain-containing protein n=1 Tax=Brevibacterium metallidurans TaxID=1482676 RepID=A0ABP3C7H7_9MICO
MTDSASSPHSSTAPTRRSANGLGDLSQPLPGASLKQAAGRFFKKYTTFTGRASRSEFWWSYLLVAVLTLVPYILVIAGVSIGTAWAAANPKVTELGVDANGEAITFEQSPGIMNHAPAATLIIIGLVLLFLVFLAVIVPFLAVTVRRLHDANMPGPMIFLILIPFVGSLIVLVLMFFASKPEGARFDVRN